MTAATLCSVLFDLPTLLNVFTLANRFARSLSQSVPLQMKLRDGKVATFSVVQSWIVSNHYSLLVTACRSAPVRLVSRWCHQSLFKKTLFIFYEHFQSEVCELFRNLPGSSLSLFFRQPIMWRGSHRSGSGEDGGQVCSDCVWLSWTLSDRSYQNRQKFSFVGLNANANAVASCSV